MLQLSSGSRPAAMQWSGHLRGDWTAGRAGDRTALRYRADPTAAQVCCTLPDGSAVRLEVVDAISSKTAQRGQAFALRLAHPLRTTENMLLRQAPKAQAKCSTPSAVAAAAKQANRFSPRATCRPRRPDFVGGAISCKVREGQAKFGKPSNGNYFVSGSTVTAGRLRVRVLEPANPTIALRDWKTLDSSEFTKGWRIDVGGSTTTYLVEVSETP